MSLLIVSEFEVFNCNEKERRNPKAVLPKFKVLSGNTFLAVAHRQFTKCLTDTAEFVSPFP